MAVRPWYPPYTFDLVLSPNILTESPLPSPYIHPDLRAAGHREAGVQRPLIPRAIVEQVRPKDGIPHDRTKGDAVLPRLVAVYKRTPPRIIRRFHHGEICPATSNILSGHIGEEGALSVAAHGGRRLPRVRKPVCVEMVALPRAVLDELQGLEIRPRRVEALEQERALLDAADYVVARDICGLRGARFALSLDARLVGNAGA